MNTKFYIPTISIKKLLFFFVLLTLAQPSFAQFSFNSIDLNPGVNGSEAFTNLDYAVLGTKLLFSGDNGSGVELMISDGTVAGTTLLKQIGTATNPSYPSEFALMNNKVYFRATTVATGSELWVTDGTTAGTQMVKDINSGSNSSTPFDFIVMNSKLYFTAETAALGTELWTSDGTSAGTVLVKDINVGPGFGDADGKIVYNNKLYFNAYDVANGNELWVSDGTSAGTSLVKDINVGAIGSAPFNFTLFAGKILFQANNGVTGKELWISDGTSAGTVLLKDINTGSASGINNSFFQRRELNGKIYFSGVTATNGTELWVTDGTTAGTNMVKDIYPGIGDGAPVSFCAFNNELFFCASDGSLIDKELWKTDGTTAGTVLVKDIQPNGSSDIYNTYVWNNKLFFIADGGLGSTIEYQLYMSDGTSAGTQLIQPAIAPNANPFSSSSIGQFYKFVPFDNKLFFTANYNSTGNDVWFLSQNNVGVNSIVRKNSTTQLYPNPSNGKELSVNIENDAHYELYDAMGRKIQTGNVLKGKNILSLPNLNNGMYVLLVNDESHKFNVQK